MSQVARIPNRDQICSYPACPRPVKQIGLCGTHYQRRWNARSRGIDDIPRIPDVRLNLYKVTRGRCTDAPGPCEAMLCRYHLADSRLGHSTDQLADTCAMRVAESGPLTLEEVGQHMAVTRERVRQIEQAAIRKLRRELEARGHGADDVREMLAAAAAVKPSAWEDAA